MPFDVSQYRVTLQDGRALALKHYRPRTALTTIPVLALHGWLDNLDSFSPMAAALVGDGIELVCVDLAGHGESDHRAGNNPYLIVNDLADIAELLSLLGWERACLLGHSRGASISALFAAALPERVIALGLIDRLWPEVYTADASIAQIRATLLQAQKAPRPYPSLEEMVRARVAAGFGISEDAASLLVKRNAVEREDGWHWRYDPLLKQKSMLMMTQEQGEVLLRSLTVPCSLIVASGGLALMEPNYAEKLTANPALQWQLLIGNHHLHMEAQADYLAQHFAAFFNSHV